jgi:hypothetical protein
MVERDDEPDRDRAMTGSDPTEDSIRQLLREGGERDIREIPDVLSGVQRKLRQRSRGKFYADGWSTSRHPPIQTYLVTSLVMLAIAGLVYAVLSPLSGSPVVAEPTAPVKVLPPTILPSARP